MNYCKVKFVKLGKQILLSANSDFALAKFGKTIFIFSKFRFANAKFENKFCKLEN